MTDYTELVKALRYCSTTKGMVYCNVNCKYGWEERSKGCKDLLMTDAAAAIEALQAAEPTEKQVVDYCHKRDLVVLEADLFHEMKASYGKLPKRGEWVRVREVDIPGEMHPVAYRCMCQTCRREYVFPRIPQYCPDCGSRNTEKLVDADALRNQLIKNINLTNGFDTSFRETATIVPAERSET